MTRMEKLQECLQIAIKHQNPDLEKNIRDAIVREAESPSSDYYAPTPTPEA